MGKGEEVGNGEQGRGRGGVFRIIREKNNLFNIFLSQPFHCLLCILISFPTSPKDLAQKATQLESSFFSMIDLDQGTNIR